MPQIMTASWFAKLPPETTPVGVSRGVPLGKSAYHRYGTSNPGHGLNRSPQVNT